MNGEDGEIVVETIAINGFGDPVYDRLRGRFTFQRRKRRLNDLPLEVKVVSVTRFDAVESIGEEDDGVSRTYVKFALIGAELRKNT